MICSYSFSLDAAIKQQPTASPPPPATIQTPSQSSAATASALKPVVVAVLGMFLMATLVPVLVASLLRLLALVAAVLLAAAASNPSDHSFALWISRQNEPADLVPDASLGVSKWFSAVYHTAKALVRNEPLTWRFHNALAFSVVFVPSRERYALGVFGTWRWADEAGDYVKALCRAPWVNKVSRGGTLSGIERYVVKGATSASEREDGARRRRKTAGGVAAGMTEVDMASHRQIRAKALQCKVRKDWKSAAALFLEAAKATGGLLTRANYELEAAWCTLEEVDTYPKEQSELVRKIRNVCDNLASAGYFDEASRGLSELAQRIKRRFPADCKTEELAKEVAELYVQAKNVAEAGGSVHNAAENGLWAARVYADAGLWAAAERCFEAVGDIRRANTQYDLANEAYGNAVLCRLGQLDIAGAQLLLNRYTEHMGESHRQSDMDFFLSSLLKACSKWSPQILETASKRYDSSHRLAPWQVSPLHPLQDVDYECEREAEEADSPSPEPILPAGALPAVFSPRPVKRLYVPTPSETPKYFRWKPQPMAPLKPPPVHPQSKPAAPPPVAPSPSALRRQNSWKVTVDARAPDLLGDDKVIPTPPLSRGGAGVAFEDANESRVAPWTEETASAAELATTPESRHLFDSPTSLSRLTTPSTKPSTPAPMSVPATTSVPSTPTTPSISPAPGTPSSQYQNRSRLATPAHTPSELTSVEPSSNPATGESTSPVTLPSSTTGITVGGAMLDSHQPQSEPIPGVPSNRPQLIAPSTPVCEKVDTQSGQGTYQLPHSADSNSPRAWEDPIAQEASALEIEQRPAKHEPVDDTLATPIVIRKPGDKQPTVFSQHVQRGVILRKYLHISNIARKLRETEQHVLRASAMAPSGSGTIGKSPMPAIAASSSAKPRKSSLERVIDSVAEHVTGSPGGPTTILHRLASVDKAITQTAHRMRLMSNASIPTLSAQNMTKGASLRTIGEGKQLAAPAQPSTKEKLQRRRPSEMSGISEDEVGVIPVRAKLDPTSAHMMRICRHVIAKRAMKSFLRQEMSVITQTEAVLRDDTALQRRPGSSVSSNRSSDRPSSRSATIDNRIPIKSMASDLVKSLAAYLKDGDQHMTVDELFLKALWSEAEKDWKRAILLASACVIIDREFMLAALLRARCCRRLGLWTQAIKDLSHAIQLRPEDQRLFLLRACLHSKIEDAENALADVNRALALHPQYTEALLLRAEIFHRGRSIGAALQDLTSVLALDRSSWRAYYDRATLRLRAIEGEEQNLVYHSEHLRYEELLAAIIQDYVNALHKGCTLVEVVETVGDLTVRLLEFTGDTTVLRQVIQNLTRLIHLLVLDPSGSLRKPHTPKTSNNSSGLGGVSGNGEYRSLSTGDRELLVAAIHAQRGRLYALSNDKVNAIEDFDHAVVMEYHYPVAHFYRGAFATLMLSKDSTGTGKDAETAAAHHANNMQHLSRCLALDPTIAGAYTVRGALHLRDLRFNNALQDFKAAVATDPTLSEVWLQIALVYLNNYHDCEEAIKACTSALANDASLTRAIYLRGEAYTRQGNSSFALQDYTRLTRSQPDDRWAHLLRGRLLLKLKMARPALYSFICFVEQVKKDPPTSRQEARIPVVTKAGKDDKPDNKGALLLCGRAYQLLSRFQSAVHAFEQAVAESPTSENLVLLSESLHSLGDTENSLRVSDKVVNTDPSSFRGYARRAQLLVSVGQLINAMAEYDRAITLAPKEGRVYYERGVVQLQLYMRWRVAFQLNFAPNTVVSVGAAQALTHSQFAPRLAACEVEKELGPDAMKDEVLVRKMMKQYFVGSITDLSKCIRLEPLLADAYVDRAELNALGEEYDRAFRDLETATERQPKNIRAHVSLGVLKCQFAAYAAAIEDFDRAIKLEAAATAEMRAFALFNRGVAYQKLELWSQAEKSYSQCISHFGRGRDVAAHRNRAIVRCHLGSFTHALEDLEEVQHSAPDDDELHGALGFALLQLNRYEDAAKHFAAYGRLGRDTYVDSGNAYFNLATKSETHLDQTQHTAYLDRARRFYLRAARLQPSNVDVRLNLANCLRKENSLKAAIAQCDVISQEQPLNHTCLESKALALFLLPGRGMDAVACMDAAVRTCVSSSANLENIFYAFSSGTIHRNALERKTIRRNGPRRLLGGIDVGPTSPTEASKATSAAATLLAKMETPAPKVHLTGSHEQMLALYMLNRGIMLEKRGNLARACQDYSDALHFDPLSVHAHVCLGTLSLREGNFEQGAAEFQRALQLDPSSGVAHLNLGVVCLSGNDLRAALNHFDAAISLLPRCSYAFANKAVALARSGDMAGAELYFKKAIDELPSRKEFYLARGKIVALQKRLHDAMVDFSTALFLGYDGKL
ncbi:unnamed protein product [Phytophthora fragariaefolia]|uniref:Unnamed protein product n=1 Tax=Phytophthora fragariaefolia TaxID=1490495 RepID=A0A9W6Y6I2_9STRA|nr:unnamed protein product [Phytophthora fragariaefolia]